MAVDLKTAARAVSVSHGLAAFASGDYDQPVVVPPTAQARPKLVLQRERVGEALSIDMQGLAPDGDITLYENDQLVGTFPDAGSVSYTTTMASPLRAEFVSGGASYSTPDLHLVHAHAMAGHDTDDDATLALLRHHDASICTRPGASGAWCDPDMWDAARVPGVGDRVLIAADADITYDNALAPRLDTVRVDGTLRWAHDLSTEMLVETIIVPPVGHLIIGEDINNRMPEGITARITISNRAYSIDANAPTNLDISRDPRLVGRGIVVLGAITTFGKERKNFHYTAAASLPLAGETSVTLAEAPATWRVGDTLVIAGTAVDLDANGVNTRYDEERVITDITGSVVSWDGPLLYNHDHHNPAVTDRPDLVLPIVVKDRNIIVETEAGAAVHQRGHIMFMHRAAKVDVWGMQINRMGRTDKSRPAGVILDTGEFSYIEPGQGSTTVIPLTADANVQSRYSIHGHFLGFKKAVVDLVRDCFIEDNKGWAGVHHGCEMHWLSNTFYRYQGSGLVGETGDEIGRWDRNVVLGLETTNGSYIAPKGMADGEGKAGDNARWGWSFFYRGRAMILTRNVAIGGTAGHVFYHRVKNNPGFNTKIPLERVYADVNDLNILAGPTIEVQDYPISHFDRCVSIGCSVGFAVVKAGPSQGHDLNIKIKNFLAWCVGNGVNLNYIGAYLLQNVDVIRSQFNSQQQYTPTAKSGFAAGRVAQVTFDNVKATGFAEGMELSGSATGGATNETFSATDPRFMVNNAEFVLCGQDIVYKTEGTVLTEDVTHIFNPPIDTSVRDTVSTDMPFIIADFDGTGRNSFSNFGAGVWFKTDIYSSDRPIPKIWDEMNVDFINKTPSSNYNGLAQRFGVWDYNGDKIVLFPLYFSDTATGWLFKEMHAVRMTGNTSNYEQRGAWTRSANPPVRAHVTRNVTVGVEDSFNVLDLATGDPGTTLSLHIPELVGSGIAEGLGTDAPAHFKANYGDIVVDKAGEVRYTAIPDSGGVTDPMLVFVYDGQGRFCTVEITYNIAA